MTRRAAARSIGKTARPLSKSLRAGCRLRECAALKREAEDACRKGLAYDASDLYLKSGAQQT